MTTSETTAAAQPLRGRPGLHGIARGSALNLLGAAVSTVAGLLVVVVATRALPQAGAGVFFTLTSLFLLVQTATSLGTGTGLVYFLARLRALGRREEIPAFLKAAILPVLALSAATGMALVLAAPTLAHHADGPSGNYISTIIVLAVALPFAALTDSLLAGTRGYGSMLPTVALDRIGRPLLQLAAATLAVTGGSVGLLTDAWVGPWLLTAGLAAWWLSRLGRKTPSSGRIHGPAWREFWSFTWPRAVNSVVQLALQRLDIVLITLLIGPAQAAIYTAATRFLVIGQLASTSIANAAQPRLAALLAVGDRTSAQAVYQATTAWIVMLTWPLYALCAVFADAILAIFGSGYGSGRAVTVILAGAMLVATACGMVDMLLNMAGRTSWTLGNSVVALTLMVGLDLFLVPRLGILGAGIGWAAAIVANNVLPLIQLFRSLGLHPFGPATLRAAALCAVCFGAFPGVARILPGDVYTVALATVAGLGLFVALGWVWRSHLGLPGLVVLRRAKVTGSLEDVPAD